MSRLLFLIAGAILALSASPIFAAPVTVSRTVGYGDLDLSTDAGRTELRQRLRTAVHDVCDEAWAGDLDRLAQARHCRNLLHAQLAAEPRLASLYGSPSLTMRLR